MPTVFRVNVLCRPKGSKDPMVVRTFTVQSPPDDHFLDTTFGDKWEFGTITRITSDW